MKPTANYSKLEGQVAQREKLLAEITRLESVASAAEQGKTDLLRSADVEDPATSSRLMELNTRTQLIPAKIAQLRADIERLQGELDVTCDSVFLDCHAGIESERARRYGQFCAAMALFYKNGIQNPFFSINTRREMNPAWRVFVETDSGREVESFVRNLATASLHAGGKNPLKRAAVLLREFSALPNIPETDQPEPSAPGLAGRLSKAAAMLFTG